MNKAQMEMLSVKSAIERTITGYTTSYSTTTFQGPENVNKFFDVVERFVASLFVSGQINNDYVVRPSNLGIEVTFSSGKQFSRLDLMLPDCLQWKERRQIPQEVELASYKARVTEGDSGAFCPHIPEELFADDTAAAASYDTWFAPAGTQRGSLVEVLPAECHFGQVSTTHDEIAAAYDYAKKFVG